MSRKKSATLGLIAAIETDVCRSVCASARNEMSPPLTKIFLADDQPLLRIGLASIIEREPQMEICGEASDCETTLLQVVKLRPHVVITELTLKGKSTIGLIRKITEFSDRINVVVYSRRDERIYAIPSFKAGAHAFVLKRGPPDEIVDAIRRVRRGAMRFSEEVGSQVLDRISAHRSDRPHSTVSSLSPRELEVVSLIASGLTSREIAREMHVSVKTVEAHRAHIKQKANLDNAIALVRFSMSIASENPLISA